jgi:L-seryl-tRNA(Ser) seleniumtransferase
MTLAALEVTLRLYLDERRLLAEVPTLRMLTVPAAELERRAHALSRAIVEACGDAYAVATRTGRLARGGGALPMTDNPHDGGDARAALGRCGALERTLRLGEPAVIARISDGRLLLDSRTLTSAEEAEVVAALARAAHP